MVTTGFALFCDPSVLITKSFETVGSKRIKKNDSACEGEQFLLSTLKSPRITVFILWVLFPKN